MNEAENKPSMSDDDILAEARERFDYCVEDERVVREEALEDVSFSLGDQWDEKVRKEREQDERPCLVINKMHQPINLVVNDGKQNRPRMKVKPVDKTADVATAEVINGLLRHIQNQSDSQAAFDKAFEDAVRCGRGFFRIATEYESEETFNQSIKIIRIENSFSVYFPMTQCKMPNYRDADYCFISDWITKEDLEAKYPDIDVSAWDTTTTGDSLWIDSERGYRIIEYFKIDKTEKTLYLLDDGKKVYELSEGDKGRVVKKRKVYKRKVLWYKMCANAILERGEFVGNWLPIIPVLGAEVNEDGERHYLSLIRFGKDPNRMYNYWKSCETEMIALAPKTPWVGAAGQFKGYEKKWAQANRKNFPYLEYAPVNAFGQLAPPPQRQMGAQVPTGIVNAIRETSDDIKATIGIWDASLGASGAEKSGIAIKARKSQGDLSNFHFYDNLAMAMEFGCRVVVDMIPYIYDAARTVRILGDDMTETVQLVNEQYRDEKTGKDMLYDMTAGQYDVAVTTGASYATKREESAQLLIQMIQANPNIAPITADLLAEFADAPTDVVERLRRAVPPNLLESEDGEDKLNPKAKAAMDAMQKQLQVLEQAFQKVVQQLEQSQAQLKDKSSELKTKVYIEEMKIRADLEKARMQLYGQRSTERMENRAEGEQEGEGEEKTVSPESIAELAAFLQATSNRLANLESYVGIGDEGEGESAPVNSEAGSEQLNAEPPPVG